MKIRLAMLVLLLLLIPLAGGAAAPDAKRTLEGQFHWSQGNETGDLRAVFTPTGAGTWDVSFNFDFDGSHTYTGTAEGKLEEGGSLEGSAKEDRGRRTWRFEGSFKNGRYEGKHFEKRGRSEEERSGTLTLFL